MNAKRNLSVRGPSIWPTPLECPNPDCTNEGKKSRPIDSVELLDLEEIVATKKDSEGNETVKAEYNANANMVAYCRHCKTSMLAGVGYFHLKRVPYAEEE